MSKGWVGNRISTGVTMLGGVVKEGGGLKEGVEVEVGIVSCKLRLVGGEFVGRSFELLRLLRSVIGAMGGTTEAVVVAVVVVVVAVVK